MEILGLLDTLESVILDSFKVPLVGKTVVDEEKLLELIDKIRLVAQSGEDFVKKAIDIGERPKREGVYPVHGEGEKEAKTMQVAESLKGKSSAEIESTAAEIVEEAYEVAKEIRRGADKYADDVLVNLEATSSKILRTIRGGRQKLANFLESEQTPQTMDLTASPMGGQEEK